MTDLSTILARLDANPNAMYSARKVAQMLREAADEGERLRGLLNEIEIRTATGEGLTPEECMAVHLMANVRDD